MNERRERSLFGELVFIRNVFSSQKVACVCMCIGLPSHATCTYTLNNIYSVDEMMIGWVVRPNRWLNRIKRREFRGKCPLNASSVWWWPPQSVHHRIMISLASETFYLFCSRPFWPALAAAASMFEEKWFNLQSQRQLFFLLFYLIFVSLCHAQRCHNAWPTATTTTTATEEYYTAHSSQSMACFLWFSICSRLT